MRLPEAFACVHDHHYRDGSRFAFPELYNNGRSTDCPFGFLQDSLNQEGKGMGQIMAAAMIKSNKKKGHYEIESYGKQYIKGVKVYTWK